MSNLITLNSVEQKYIATCYPLPDRKGIEKCNVWKHKLQTQYSAEKKDFFILGLNIGCNLF